MKVLFVSSGNTKNGISPIIKNQGESLKPFNIEIEYFTIQGKGVKGYFNAIFKLKKHLKSNAYDVVHAHYWISAIVASFAGAKPMVVSLMGDDVKAYSWSKWIIYLFKYFSWSAIIVKSKDMYETLGLKSAYIIPNGINMQRFKPINQQVALNIVNWNPNKKHILFTSNPKRAEKNFTLAKKAVEYLNNPNLELHYLDGVANEDVPYYYNAASVVILTSLWEGSPNAIKESMACNTPIVSTVVGDAQDVIKNTEGCYTSSFDHKEFASKIQNSLDFGQKTTGRRDIDYLKSEIIAKKIIAIYNSIKEK